MNRSTVLILILILFAVPVLAQSGAAAGTWDVTLNSPQAHLIPIQSKTRR
jgi:hypothetical protein